MLCKSISQSVNLSSPKTWEGEVWEDEGPGFATWGQMALTCPFLFLSLSFPQQRALVSSLLPTFLSDTPAPLQGSGPSLITASHLGASALRHDPGSPGSSLALVPTSGPLPPCPESRPHASPSNRHCSVGRSKFTTNYFVLREGQKEKRSWEGWGTAGGGDCLSRLCVVL